MRNKYGSQVKFACSVKIVGCILQNVMQYDVNNAQCSVHLAQCPVNKAPAALPSNRCIALTTNWKYLKAHFHTPVRQALKSCLRSGEYLANFDCLSSSSVLFNQDDGHSYICELISKRTRINNGKLDSM